MGHALRGAATAWLALIALQTIGTSGTGRVASLFADADRLVKRALDPTVPAIPDLRAGQAWGSTGTAPAAPAAAGMTNPYLASALATSAPSTIHAR